MRPHEERASTAASLSIKSRAALISTLGVLLLIALSAALIVSSIRQTMRDAVGSQQLTLVTRVADELNDKINFAHSALIVTASGTPPELLGRLDVLERSLTAQPGFRSFFDDVLVIGVNGRVLVDIPDLGRRGIDVRDRAYFQRTMELHAPVVSEPYLGRGKVEPTVMMTAPILDGKGAVVGMLAGALHPLSPNFLGKLGDASVGKTGSFALFTRDRIIVVSKDKSRIMTQGPAPGISPSFDHAVAGNAGWEESVNSRGLRAVFSYAPLASVPWVLSAALPVTEAYGPIISAEKRVLGVALAIALLVAPLVWFGMGRLLAPVGRLRDAIRRVRANPSRATTVDMPHRDELGDLAADFNAMLAELHQRNRSLVDSELRFRKIFDAGPVAKLVVERSGTITMASETVRDVLGHLPEELIGQSLFTLVPRNAHDGYLQTLERGAAVPFRDAVALRKEGTSIPVELSFTPFDTSTGSLTIVSMADISDRLHLMESLRHEVAERLRAEEDLRANEVLMRSTFEQAAVGIAHIAPNTLRILRINDKFCRLLGYNRDELIDTDSRRLTPPEDLPARNNERARVMSGVSTTSSSERQLIRKDGSTIWVNRSLSLVRDVAGDPLYFISVIEDISGKKAAEQASAREKLRLETILRTASDGIHILDVDGILVEANDAFLRLLGQDRSALGRMNVEDWDAQDDRIIIHARNLALIQAKESTTYETRYRRHDGQLVDVEISACGIEIEGRGFLYASARDIGERKRKIALLNLLESMARATNEALTPEEGLKACMQRICSYGNWSVGHVVLFAEGGNGGLPVKSIWAGNSPGSFEELERKTGTYSFNRPGGRFGTLAIQRRSPVWIEDFGSVQTETGGRMGIFTTLGFRAGFVVPLVIGSDIAGLLEFFDTKSRERDDELMAVIDNVAGQLARSIERDRSTRELARLNAELETRVIHRTAELEAANKELNSFSYAIAHDMRAPVRAISGFGEIVMRGAEGRLDARTIEHLKRITTAADHMGHLIDDLLKLANLSRKRMERHRFDLSAVAAAVAAEMSAAHPQRNVAVAIQPGMQIDADAGLMRAVLANLIGNAWKFTAKTAAPAVAIGALERDGSTTYFVRDNGAGFDMKYANKLFAPFQRLHHIDEFEGTGIGLATVKKIIDRHHGKVWAESAVDAGTTIYFTVGG